MDQKLVVFDMDNTLILDRFIDVCAEQFKFQQALSLLRHLDKNPVSLTQRIAKFLKDRRRAELIEIADSIPLVPDIVDVVLELKNRSYIIGIISDSYQLITGIIAKKINAEFTMANELLLSEERVTGELNIPLYFQYSPDSVCRHSVCKTHALKYICNVYQSRPENCVVVGDSDNDVCMLKHAGLGIAFCTTSNLVRQSAAKHIDQRSFSELLNFTP
ncbi:MAG TPA: HAD-IB family phosphatase [Chitinophagaceae bacterium]|nr:HAD-IB family phosphatase [Chitinophagaceae bacterium]